MPKANRDVPVLSDAEETRLQEQIANDPDNPELTDEELAAMRPASEALPPVLYAALTRPRGRPKAEVTKVPVKLRLDQSVIDGFKALGPGWQTRMNDFLATRDEIVKLILGYEASAGEMRNVLAMMRDGSLAPLTPNLAKSLERAERQIAMTEDAARAVRRVLNEQAHVQVRS